MKNILKEVIPYVVVILIVVIIRSFFFTFTFVDGTSMEETLKDGEVLFINKIGKGNIERNDIVIVKRGNNRLVKRAVGLPGERIRCVSGVIYINGEELEKDYGYGKTENFQEVTLADNEYFVIGDNREDSYDSRSFGPVVKDNIIGKAEFIIFPFTRIQKI